jgi:urate oxidase
MRPTVHYGKGNITLYRTYARPLAGVTAIPESSFTGRANTLFAADVEVTVFGDHTLASYTEGDNSHVLATDTMKNFVLKQALAYEGSTLEGFLHFLGRRFLATYPDMQTLRLTGREQPFADAPVPFVGGFKASEVLFSRRHDDYAVAALDVERDGDGARIAAHRCGQVGLQLIKVTGSSFTRFVRDEHTTLPERVDRPLFIYLDVFWRYADPALVTGDDPARYVAAEQARDLTQVVFHQFNSKSIQHLVYEMGTRLLARFPQLAEVSFDAQNRLWDTAFESEFDAKVKVYCDPRPPYGLIHLTLARDEAPTSDEQRHQSRVLSGSSQ